MLKIKLQQESNSNTWYKIKLNGKIIDYGVLRNDEETLCYKDLQLDNVDKSYVSISCSDQKTLGVKEIHLNNSKILAKEHKDYGQINYIVSGVTKDINEILQNNFTHVRMSTEIGSNAEWFFTVDANDIISTFHKEDGWIDHHPVEQEPKNGVYVYEMSDGTIYEGQFENDLINGYGKMTMSDGTIYEGEFENDVINGYGKMTMSDGTKYEGQFENDVIEGPPGGFGKAFPRHGKMTMFDELTRETLLDGEFTDGLFVEGTKHFPSGEKELGMFSGDNKNLELISGIYIDVKGISHIIKKEKLDES
jgi:hypothetical protein